MAYEPSFFFFLKSVYDADFSCSPVITPWLFRWLQVERLTSNLSSLIGKTLLADISLETDYPKSYAFNDAITAFKATRAGKSEDGKGVIKAIISGPE